MIKEPEAMRVVSLMLTWQCNLNCTYCFEAFKRNDRTMTAETARKILSSEFDAFRTSRERENGGYLKIEFFGGEPLLRFDVIREVTEWIETLDLPFKTLLSVTSNGTLLDAEKQAWFTAHKERIRIVLSVDGTQHIQQANRGKAAAATPLDFARRMWPDLPFKATISRTALPTLGSDLITLLEQGHCIAPNLAVGEAWQEGDEKIYKRELTKLAEWHLAHPEREPMRIFMQHYIALLEPWSQETPQKNCGTGTTMATYDVDGTAYPCHMFVPITHGKSDAIRELAQIDFRNDSIFMDDECSTCKILRICKTCYGFNYKDRGSVRKRDRRVCRMMLAEAQVVSAFQIHYLLELKKRRALNPFELTALQGAVRCQELYADFDFEVQ